MRKAVVAGVGMVKFTKPGQHEPYRVMGANAIREAITDAGIDHKLIEQAYASYIYGDSTSGEHVLYDAFMTGIPVFNVNNNCASGSNAIYLARQAVEGGSVECALAFGFEQMQTGALKSHWEDREMPTMDSVYKRLVVEFGYPQGKFLAGMSFGAAGDDYMKRYDAKSDIFAKVAVKSRNHAGLNPNAVFTAPLTEQEVLESPVVYLDYLTRYMCCPPTCGAAAAIICSPEFAKKHGIENSVEIAGQVMATDVPDSFTCPMNLVGYDSAQRAASRLYEMTGMGPEDVDVVELHDCFTTNEVITYEALQLCPEGGATEFIANGDNTYGGKFVVNPSGGLMSKGHPIGATGVAQCYELVHHLRGTAGQRQVQGAKVALQHNLGVGGGVVVTQYKA